MQQQNRQAGNGRVAARNACNRHALLVLAAGTLTDALPGSQGGPPFDGRIYLISGRFA